MNFSDNDKIKLAGRIGWFAAIFSVAMSVLLIANFVQTKLNDPINNKTIPALVKRLSQNPADENLKGEIRAFDLMARKAYFTSHWQIRTGSYLLILGVLIAILSVRTISSITTKPGEIDQIEHVKGLDELMARKWIIYSGAGLLLLALVSGFLSTNMLNEYKTEESPVAKEEKAVITAIEPIQNPSTTSSEIAAKTFSRIENQKSKTVDSTKAKVAAEPPKQPVIAAVLAFPTLAELKTNYPFFRGAEGIGIAYQKNTLTEWNGNTGKNLVWKVKIPKPGFSSPIIWGNQLFVTGADAQARMVYCYDKNNGKLLWEAAADKIEGSTAGIPKVSTDTGLAAPTMVFPSASR